MKLRFLRALLAAIAGMSKAVAAISADDFETAEAELVEVHRILAEQAEELRAA